uniref:Uncharacterized protein n=1 Tax=Setaria italica TaxID=4555 RepID=K3XP62_SETIT
MINCAPKINLTNLKHVICSSVLSSSFVVALVPVTSLVAHSHRSLLNRFSQTGKTMMTN